MKLYFLKKNSKKIEVLFFSLLSLCKKINFFFVLVRLQCYDIVGKSDVMKRTEETHKTKNGYDVTIRTVETDFQDGFVQESEIHPIFTEDDIGKSHLGIQKHISMTTDDPRVTRPVILITSLIILGIGFGVPYLDESMSWLWIITVPLAIIFFVSGQMQISKVVREKKQKKLEESLKEDGNKL